MQVQVHPWWQVQVVEERSIPVVRFRREEVNNNSMEGRSRRELCRMCAGSTLLQVRHGVLCCAEVRWGKVRYG